MPLQSFAQRTVSHLPHGIRRSLLKLTRPSSPTISQRQPKSKRVVVDAFCITGGWPSPQRFWRSWCGLNLAWCLLQRLIAGSRGPFVLQARPEGLAFRALDSSLGVHQRSPLRQYRCRASTPGRAEARLSARSCQTPDAFRPCRSSRLRRLTPLDTLQVCCTLHPAMGFAKFRVCSLPCARRRGVEGSPSPVAFYPSEFSPPRQAEVRHRTPIPSRRCSEFLVVGPPVLPRLAPRPSARHSTSGHCSAAKSVASLPAFPLTDCPILPWAWSQAGSDAFPSPLRGVAGGCPSWPRRTAEGWPGIRALRRSTEAGRVGVRCMAWWALAPRGFGPVRPARRRAPRGPPVPSTRLPPGGGCAVGSSVCRARRHVRSKGRARWRAP
jgi:hypothetical protein